MGFRKDSFFATMAKVPEIGISRELLLTKRNLTETAPRLARRITCSSSMANCGELGLASVISGEVFFNFRSNMETWLFSRLTSSVSWLRSSRKEEYS